MTPHGPSPPPPARQAQHSRPDPGPPGHPVGTAAGSWGVRAAAIVSLVLGVIAIVGVVVIITLAITAGVVAGVGAGVTGLVLGIVAHKQVWSWMTPGDIVLSGISLAGIILSAIGFVLAAPFLLSVFQGP